MLRTCPKNFIGIGQSQRGNNHMTGIALGIVLTFAFMHAGWNYLTKKSRNKAAFI
jgi:hypothetical protein